MGVKCVNCGKDVIPVKNFSTGKVVMFGALSLIHQMGKSARICPVCGNDVYIVKPPPEKVP